MTGLGVWQPLALDVAARLFHDLAGRWWIAGGWAIDLFLGRQTRDHADLDISILRADQARLSQLLRGWEIHVAHDGRLTPWDGEPLVRPRHQFWVRRERDAPWAFEILIEDHDRDRWLYRKDHAIAMPLERLGRVGADCLPYICPEVALLFKSGRPGHDRNAHDFQVAALALDPAGRAWLRQALAAAEPSHPWLDLL